MRRGGTGGKCGREKAKTRKRPRAEVPKPFHVTAVGSRAIAGTAARALGVALAATRVPALLGGAAALRAGHASAARVGLPTTRAAGFVAATGLLVHRRPRAALGFVLPGASR